MEEFEEPFLPFAGTSGWSGSETSRERAEKDDTDGTTSKRQQETLAALVYSGVDGLTWKELATQNGWHHGQASGVLSVLHKEGQIVRLADERRARCAVYVRPEFANGRPLAEYGRSKNESFWRETIIGEILDNCRENHTVLPCDCKEIIAVVTKDSDD